jgi:hypothetical protein
MSGARDKSGGYQSDAQQAAGAPAGGSPGARETGGYDQGDARMQDQGARDPGMRETGGTRTDTRGEYGRTEYGRAEYGRGGYGESGGAAQTGFTVLAASLMILAGLWSFLEGLIGIIHKSFYAAQPNYTYAYSIHGWGWVHLALGIALFAAGACVLLGQTWAKVVGIVLAVFSAIANFMFLPYYPVWSIVVIAIDLFIIWALATGIGRRATA